MRPLARLLAALLLVAASAAPARAQSTLFLIELTGAAAVPPTASPGFGLGLFFYDVGSGAFEIGFGFNDLTSPATAALLARGGPGETGTTVLDLSTALPPGATTGSAEPRTGALGRDDEARLFRGELYLTIATDAYPTGEIRGQFAYLAGPVPPPSVVPEPGTVLLVATGLVGIGVVARRRRGDGGRRG